MGGVLEHPAASRLWPTLKLPLPGYYDEYGGFSICIDQFWYGHKAQKKTLLYICGIKHDQLPPMPIRFDAITHVIGYNKKNKFGRVDKTKKEVSKAEREHTPIQLAKWLIEVASKCKAYSNGAVSTAVLNHIVEIQVVAEKLATQNNGG